MLTLPFILDSAYALLYEEYQRLGLDSVKAMDEVSDYISFPDEKREYSVASKTERVPSELDNSRALAEFENLMKGVPGLR